VQPIPLRGGTDLSQVIGVQPSVVAAISRMHCLCLRRVSRRQQSSRGGRVAPSVAVRSLPSSGDYGYSTQSTRCGLQQAVPTRHILQPAEISPSVEISPTNMRHMRRQNRAETRQHNLLLVDVQAAGIPIPPNPSTLAQSAVAKSRSMRRQTNFRSYAADAVCRRSVLLVKWRLHYHADAPCAPSPHVRAASFQHGINE